MYAGVQIPAASSLWLRFRRSRALRKRTASAAAESTWFVFCRGTRRTIGNPIGGELVAARVAYGQRVPSPRPRAASTEASSPTSKEMRERITRDRPFHLSQ